MKKTLETKEVREGREAMYTAHRLREWASSYEGDVNAGRGFEEFGKHQYCVSWFYGDPTITQQILQEFDKWAESYPEVAKDLTLTRGNCHKPFMGWDKSCMANYNSIFNTIEFDHKYCEQPKLWNKFGGVEAGVRDAVARTFELAIEAYNSELEPIWTGVCRVGAEK